MDVLADLCVANFVEMRDLVADPKFLVRKEIEAKLHELYPKQWIPQYTMVTFTDTPYSEALMEGTRKDQIMQKLMETPGIESNWQDMDFSSIIEKISPNCD